MENNDKPGKAIAIDRIVYDVMPQFQRIALKRQLVRWEEESQYALQACKANPKLLKCEPTTIQDAIINVASVGLSLQPASGHAYLVPEYNTQAKATVCQLRVSFKGLIKLAVASGSISWVHADVVKEKDTFEYRGVNEYPIHSMDPFTDRGKTVGAYCIARTTGGDLLVDTINREQLDRIKGSAKTQFVWDAWYDEMCKKAIIKRSSKQWPPGPGSQQLDESIQIINDAEGSDFEEFEQLEKTAAYIAEALKEDDFTKLGEAWDECTEQEKSQLWRAITKGGYFTQADKVKIRALQSQYREANMTDEQKQAKEERKKETDAYFDEMTKKAETAQKHRKSQNA